MRETVTFTANLRNATYEALPVWKTIVRSYLEPFKPYRIEEGPFGPVMDVIFDRYHDEFEQVRIDLRRVGIGTDIWVWREYDDGELLEAEYLDLSTRLEVDSVTGTLKWDLLPVCPYCGFRETAWILPDIRIKNEPESYQLGAIDYHPKAVTAHLAREFQLAGLSGLELVALGDNDPPGWYALDIKHRLGPMQSPPTRLRRLAAATALCERNHNLERPDSEFSYRREGFEALDFNVTHEIFGDSEATGRGIVISNRVYRLLVKLGVRGLRCEPVRLLD